MGPLQRIALAVLCISFITFVALFGRLPALRNTPISFLYRLIWTIIPRTLCYIDNRLTGGLVIAKTLGLANYLINEKHPTILALFLAILFVSEALFIPSAWPRLSIFHRLLMPIVVSVPYVSIYLSAFTSPGIITARNLSKAAKLYPYDFILFGPGSICRTCKTEKPARSKHCKICKACIMRQDHHCVWINNCVGYGNYHWFMSILWSVEILLNYGVWLGFKLLSVKIQNEAPNAQLHWSTGLSWREYVGVWGWAVQENPRVGAVGLLCLLCSPLAGGFAIYHTYLIWAGMTTNEHAKWGDLRDAIYDDRVFIADRKKVSKVRGMELDAQGSNTGEGNWPTYTGKVVVTTQNIEETDGPSTGDLENDRMWTLVYSLRDLTNIYDLGLWENAKDVFLSQG